MNILVCDDDREIAGAIEIYLRNEGYRVYKAFDGAEALGIVEKEEIHLIIMDVMMPKLDGVQATMKIRESKNIPIIMLSAKSEDYDKITGLNVGADDYITKPFDSEVLLHKIKAILKRNEEIHREEVNAEFDLGKYHFNPRLRELSVNGKVQTLSPKENELLKMLAEYKNDLLPREAALKRIWGSDTYFNGRSMDVYIAKLRKYLKEDSKLEIVNIHGNGFRLVEQE